MKNFSFLFFFFFFLMDLKYPTEKTIKIETLILKEKSLGGERKQMEDINVCE